MPATQRRTLAKRSACDRCRQQKLRCLRSQGQGDEACARCARAGASCVTGDARPLGRAHASSTGSHPLVQKKPREPRHSVFVTVLGSTMGRKSERFPAGEERSAATAAPALRIPTPPSDEGRAREQLRTDHDLSQGMPSPNFSQVVSESQSRSDPDAFDFGLVEETAPFSPETDTPTSTKETSLPMNRTTESPLCADLVMAGQLSSKSTAETLEDCTDSSLYLLPPEATAPTIAASLSEPSFRSSNILTSLAQLNEGIGHQLSSLGLFVGIMPTPDVIHYCIAQVADLQINPMLKALDSTTRLAATIKQIISPMQNRDASSSVLSTPVVLMCLSAHLQLLQIFDSLLFHSYLMLSSLHDVADFFENLPGFTHIQGLPPISGDLYVKLVVQIVQHTIGGVERVLGLPGDVRLTAAGRGSSNGGLLGHVGSPEVFRGMMDQACGSSEKSGRALVASLRLNIGNILGLLDDGG